MLPRSAVAVSFSHSVTPTGGVTWRSREVLDLPICVRPRWKLVPSRDAGKVQFECFDDNEIEKRSQNLSDSWTEVTQRVSESHKST